MTRIRTEGGIKESSYVIQEVDELLELGATQVAHITLPFCAIVELTEGNLKFSRGPGELAKTPE